MSVKPTSSGSVSLPRSSSVKPADLRLIFGLFRLISLWGTFRLPHSMTGLFGQAELSALERHRLISCEQDFVFLFFLTSYVSILFVTFIVFSFLKIFLEMGARLTKLSPGISKSTRQTKSDYVNFDRNAKTYLKQNCYNHKQVTKLSWWFVYDNDKVADCIAKLRDIEGVLVSETNN